MGHVALTTPLLGVICHSYARSWQRTAVYKSWRL